MQVGSIGRRQDEPGDFVGIPPKQTPASVSASKKKGKERLSRTAVVIRTWADYSYTPEDLIYLRSLISELNILSGGEYVIHFLIQVHNNDIPIFSDDDTYERVLRDALPEEFRGMGTLWNERQMHPDVRRSGGNVDAGQTCTRCLSKYFHANAVLSLSTSRVRFLLELGDGHQKHQPLVPPV